MRARRTRFSLALTAALALAAAAAAQDVPPDVPAGDATITGHIVHDDRPDAGADAPVILYSLTSTGEPGLRQTRADASGAFRFEGISGDPQMVYLVGTRVSGVPFGARVSFAEGETLREVEIAVSEPSRQVEEVAPTEAQIHLQRGCSHLRVQHRHPMQNDTDRVVFVPPEEREGATPLLELLLPEGASAIESPVGDALEGFDREGRRLRFWGPVYPGTGSVDFAYGVPLASEIALRIGFPSGAETLRVFTPPEGVRVTSAALRDEGEVALPSGPARAQRADAIEPGTELALEVALDEPADAPALRIFEARMWLELDDAALDASEQYELQNASAEPLESSSGAPLLCVELPEGASALRFSNASLAMGLSRDPGGALSLHGPIPHGDSTLALRYQLPAEPGNFRFTRSFSRDVPLLTLLVADTGLVPHASRLHRRRPVRTEDRSYLHLEAFGIEAGETVAVDLEPVPRRGGLPGYASSGFVLLAGLSALWFLIAPLRTPEQPAEAEAPDEAISTERQSVYRSIEALDEDFETGKLTREDHERMRSELRARAVALLAQERAASHPTPVTTPEKERSCGRCGAAADAQHRFCAQCGAPLDEDAA
jgi:hypothetical protein